MPYKSAKQKRYLKSQKPEVAKKFDKHEPKKKKARPKRKAKR